MKGENFTTLKAKEKLLASKKELISQLDSIAGQDPYRMSGYSDENTQDDDAFEREGHARADSLQQEIKTLLQKVEKALGKIELGKYGKCESCGKQIDQARLEALPYAPYCLRCEKMKENIPQ